VIVRVEHDKDRIVLKHEVPQDEGKTMFTWLVASEGLTRDWDGNYLVIWKSSKNEYEGSWTLSWKGDWEGCIKYMMPLVQDLDVDYHSSLMRKVENHHDQVVEAAFPQR
jgi:hypothetical protein